VAGGDDGFAKLEIGAQVPGNDGPQASTVTPLGKHHIVA
jgi:hypothetical protein